MNDLPIHLTLTSNSLGIRRPGDLESLPVRKIVLAPTQESPWVLVRYFSAGGILLDQTASANVDDAKRHVEKECELPAGLWKRGTGEP